MWKWPLLLFAVSFCFFAIQSGDVMMNMAIARDFILAGEWRQTDIHHYLYSATDGVLIWHHEYLSSLIFYLAWMAGGFPALIILKSTLLAAMFLLVLKSEPQENDARAEWIALWILAVVAASFRFIERASLFSDLFTVLLVAWLLREPKIRRSFLIRLCALFWLWIQLHPGFFAGFFLVLLWAVARDRKSAWKLLAIPAVMLLNPDFHRGLLYPLRFALYEAQTLKHYNYEWLPSYHQAFRFSFEMIAFWLLAISSLWFFVQARAWRKLESLFALVSLALALLAVRFIPAAAMILAMSVKPFARFHTLDRPQIWLRAGFFILLVTITVRNLGWGYESSAGRRIPHLSLDPKFFPSRTLETLKQIHPARFYNSHDFGAYLVWLGITPVFHHGFVTDMDFYVNEVMGSLRSQKEFQELARKYDWKVLLIDRFGGYRQAHAILSPLKEWKIVAEDEAAYLIVYLP